MKGRLLIAILLIVLGTIALGYGRISFTRDKEVADLGPIEITKEERETIPLSPVLGAIALASGFALAFWPRHA